MEGKQLTDDISGQGGSRGQKLLGQCTNRMINQ